MPIIAQLLSDPNVKSYLSSHRTPLNPTLEHIGLLTPRNSSPTLVPTPGTMESTLPYQAGDMLGSITENKQLLKPLGSYLSNLGARHGMSALATGAGLGALGAGYGWLTDRDPLLWGGIGAGLGAAGGYGISNLVAYLNRQRQMRYLRQKDEMQKYGFYVSSGEDPESYIQSRLFADASMDPSSKSQMMISLQQLPPEQLFTLANLLRSAAGAGVGYLIGRFLLNLGGVGQGISAGLGGLVGAMFGRGSSLPRNVYGQEVDTQHDPFGGQRFIS